MTVETASAAPGELRDEPERAGSSSPPRSTRQDRSRACHALPCNGRRLEVANRPGEGQRRTLPLDADPLPRAARAGSTPPAPGAAAADLRAARGLRLLLLDPGAVVTARPGEVDLARAHGVVGALHAERADVDMRDHDRDQDHPDDGVDVLRPLHAVDVGDREREQHDDAGHRQRDAAERPPTRRSASARR